MKILAGNAINRRYQILRNYQKMNKFNTFIGIASTAGSAAVQNLPMTIFWLGYTLLNKIIGKNSGLELLEKYKPEYDKIVQRAKRIKQI